MLGGQLLSFLLVLGIGPPKPCSNVSFGVKWPQVENASLPAAPRHLDMKQMPQRALFLANVLSVGRKETRRGRWAFRDIEK